MNCIATYLPMKDELFRVVKCPTAVGLILKIVYTDESASHDVTENKFYNMCEFKNSTIAKFCDIIIGWSSVADLYMSVAAL